MKSAERTTLFMIPESGRRLGYAKPKTNYGFISILHKHKTLNNR